MIYLNKFDTHASYEAELNVDGGLDISSPNVSYCEDVKDVHYTPCKFVRFYVGEISGTTPQTVKIYTDATNYVDVQVSKGNKWYTYALPKDKGLHSIKSGVFNRDDGWTNSIVKKVAIKANINYTYNTDDGINELLTIIPTSTIEVSFNGSDTSKLIDMDGMFFGCGGLTSLNVSSFNTSEVLSMYCTFYGCIGLTSLNLSGWDTSKVINMNGMFTECSGLTSLTLSNFNTSNVTSFDIMFGGCTNLAHLDLSGWNISKATSMAIMFGNCIGLKSLDLSGWDTSNVTNMNSMFAGCSNLGTIIMKGCSSETIDKIKAQLAKDNITGVTIDDGKTGVTITQ